MADKVAEIETFTVTIPRKQPYLGRLESGVSVNENGYFVRPGNRTVYPIFDRSVCVRVTTADGATGWGETYGICAPGAITAIVHDLLTPFVVGRDPFDVKTIWDDLYDMMRVRGFFGGFYVDAIAAIDIALWDLCGQLSGKPLSKLLGEETRSRIPAYVSGLPGSTVSDKCIIAENFVDRGYDAFKVAAVVSGDTLVAEVGALRETLGDESHLMVDLHWKYTAPEAMSMLSALEKNNLYFAEAPCKPEDIQGLAKVIDKSNIAIAAGEEWRTTFDARPRLEAGLSIAQPEMGHTGVTQFMRIAELAKSHDALVIPHASIGVGIFQAASLHATATLPNAPFHEYQHTVFNRNLKFLETDMDCKEGDFSVPTGVGLGVRPSPEFWKVARGTAAVSRCK